MKQSLFCIQDSVAGTCSAPYMLPNEAVAMRAFAQLVNDPASRVHQSPGDYSLFFLGTYDDETAMLVVEPSKVFLSNGATNVAAKNPEISQ